MSNFDLSTDLYNAILFKNKELVKDLLNNGAYVNTVYDDDCTPLLIATYNGDIQCMKVLLEYGADVNKENSFNGETPLFSTIKYNNSNYSFDISIKIRKNKKILISGGFIIPLFKILIEPDKILGYQKIDKTFFSTDFGDIYDKLGFTLDFNQIQNILTGEPLNNLFSIANYNTYEIDNNLIVYEYVDDVFSVSLFFDTNLNKLIAQEIKQIELARELSIYYKDFKETNNSMLHTSSKIVVNDGKNLINLYMSTNSTDTSDEILFPFEIPNNYRKIKF